MRKKPIKKNGRVYRYEPNGFDMAYGVKNVAKGQLVRKCQPYGCPKNGTMGMAYVEDMDGKFLEMVCMASLIPAGGQK